MDVRVGYKESWALKNWCFWTVALEKTLESPLDSKEIKPVNPKGNNREYSLEGPILKLKLQYFGHLMRRAHSLEKRPWCWERLKVGEGDDRGRDGWMASQTQLTWVWASSRSWWWHPSISSSVTPFFSYLQSFPALGPFLMIWLFTSGGKSIWSFSISSSNEYSGLNSFRIDWFDLLSVQGNFKSFLQRHSSKASILQCSAFFIVHE